MPDLCLQLEHRIPNLIFSQFLTRGIRASHNVSFTLCSCVYSIQLSYRALVIVVATSNSGITVELISRDSPKSPFYNAS
jgi:hypothetical protein